MVSKLVCGVGINDADYAVKSSNKDLSLRCPYYAAWHSMIYRCYSPKRLANHPAYVKCTVSPEWLIFSNFRAWMLKQDWKGLQLDKDIICPGNTEYSEATCCFISQQVNLLLNTNAKTASGLGAGVTKAPSGRYAAKINKHPKKVHLGTFDTPEEANTAYQKAKIGRLVQIAYQQSNPLIKQGLLRHAKEYTTV